MRVAFVYLKKIKVLLVGAFVLVLTAVLVFINIAFISPGSQQSRFTDSGSPSLEFERIIYDESRAKELARVHENIALAGPLFRTPSSPIQFVEMSADLNVLGTRDLNDDFFYAASSSRNGDLIFMGGGCADKSGAWATCSQVTQLTTTDEIVDKASQKLELDFHEFEGASKSDYWAIRYSKIDCTVDSPKHCGIDANGVPASSIGDCHIVHVVDKTIISEWSAYKNLPDGESTSTRYGETSDVFHCNSIDAVSIDGEVKLLVSMRNTDSIYLIDAESGAVDWKLGGNSWDGVSLEITNPGTLGISTTSMKPELVLSGQHDARYWGNGIFSVFDNRSKTGLPARGIVFTVNNESKSLTVEKVFNDPDGNPSGCTGSFRQLDQGKYWVAGWGCSESGITVFSEDTEAIVSTKLNQNSVQNNKITDESMGRLRWTLSYRVVVE